MPNKSNDDTENGGSEGTVSTPEAVENHPSEEINDESPEQSFSPETDKPQTSDSTIGLSEAQNRAKEAAEELLEHEFEGIIKVEAATESGWRTVVEFVERSAVPDTQDIIGRYEITLNPTGSVTGYELLERYRRGDMKEEL